MGPTDWQWIANFGFAAVVATILLLRIEPTIKHNTEKVMKAISTNGDRTTEAITAMARTVTLLTVVLAKANGVDYDQVRKDYIDGSEYDD